MGQNVLCKTKTVLENIYLYGICMNPLDCLLSCQVVEYNKT